MKEGSKVKKGWKSKMWIIILIIFAIFVIGSMAFAIFLDTDRKYLQNVDISNINFDDLKDGKYSGEFKGKKFNWRDVKVEVTVSNGDVVDIAILNERKDKNGKPIEIKDGETINSFLDRVVEKQTLQVDTISGATVSSNAILVAVEDALKKAK